MSRQPRGANREMEVGGKGLGRDSWTQGTSAIQVAAITLFIQFGKMRHRESKRLTQGLQVSYVPLRKDSSSHSLLIWPHLWL